MPAGAKAIVIDKSSQTVGLYGADGKLIDAFLCASGRYYPKAGDFEVFTRKARSSSLYDDTTVYFFTVFQTSEKGNNIGFHSIPVDRSGKPVGGLGAPVSHGCVRLDRKKAELIYRWASNGTRVKVQD